MTKAPAAQRQGRPEAPVSIPPPAGIADAIGLLDRALFDIERAQPEGTIDCIERAKCILKALTSMPSKRRAQSRRLEGARP